VMETEKLGGSVYHDERERVRVKGMDGALG
jgi:hypothetical protein